MSEKNFMAFGDAETVLTGFATDIKAKQPKTLETPITIEGVQKTTVESALQGLVGSVADGKALVASAITNKGVSTSANASFATMATNIGAIPTGADWNNKLDIELQAISTSSTETASLRLCIYFGQFVNRDIKRVYTEVIARVSGSSTADVIINLLHGANDTSIINWKTTSLLSPSATAGTNAEATFQQSEHVRFGSANASAPYSSYFRYPRQLKLHLIIEFY